MIVVSDATPLIALAKIEKTALLKILFGKIQVPQSVYDEVVTNAKGRPGALEVSQASWIEIQSSADQTKVDYLRADLDAGEAEALVLAEELRANWILIDEAKARLAADLLKLRYIGTIGLLLLAKQLAGCRRSRTFDCRTQIFTDKHGFSSQSDRKICVNPANLCPIMLSPTSC